MLFRSYLYQVHSLLDEKLHKTERKAWLDEELSKLFNDENNFQVASDKLWQRVKGSTKLTRKKLAIVQSIALWREQLAQKKDKTRRKILSDDIIIQLAIEPPENTNILNQNIDHRTHFNDKEKQQLFETIQTAFTCPENQWPDNQFTILDKQQKTLLKTLQQCVNNRAEKLGISSAVLCSRKELIMLIVSQKQQDKSQQATLNILQGWRLHCLGQHLLETIKNAK